MANDPAIRRGVYDADYFSGAQVALYIGDIWVDEVTSLAFNLSEPRAPLYGYADTLFRDTSRGQVLVTGNFTINFKEAGYLWLVLNQFQTKIARRQSPLDTTVKGKDKSHIAKTFNIEEQYVRNYLTSDHKDKQNTALKALSENYARLLYQTKLTGFSNTARGLGAQGNEMHGAESIFEEFENAVWGTPSDVLDAKDRRPTDPDLNPFDIYITYGDYAGDDRLHHTIQKLQRVYLVSVGKRIVIDGSPIQEEYGFIARNLV